MSHQRNPSEATKAPHSISLKVLRLARPSLATQHAYASPQASYLSTTGTQPLHVAAITELSKPNPGSLAYSIGTTTCSSPFVATDANSSAYTATNPFPFILSPILNLPPSFGTAYVGETFACALCVNHEVMASAAASARRKTISDLRIEAEMKTPSGLSMANMPSSSSASSGGGSSSTIAVTAVNKGIFKLELKEPEDGPAKSGGTQQQQQPEKYTESLEPGRTLQRNLSFDLKEEGNHVLAVTVAYYEKTETSGKMRTFRKLYQFLCKGSITVRTKCTVLRVPWLESGPLSHSLLSRSESPDSFPPLATPYPSLEMGKDERKEEIKGQEEIIESKKITKRHRRQEKAKLKWILEAQLENCTDSIMQLDRITLELIPGLRARSCLSWDSSPGAVSSSFPTCAFPLTTVGCFSIGGKMEGKPVLHPMEIEQVAFIVEEDTSKTEGSDKNEKLGAPGASPTAAVHTMPDGRLVFGMLGIGWQNEMGNRGFLNTGRLIVNLK